MFFFMISLESCIKKFDIDVAKVKLNVLYYLLVGLPYVPVCPSVVADC